MGDFYKAIQHIIANEGGYTEHPSDPGGATNHGISYRFLKSLKNYSHIDKDFIKTLTIPQAESIYKEYFWDPNRYSEINDQSVATKVFDLCVNMGAYQVHKILQKSINVASNENRVIVDGKIGPRTISETNKVSPNQLIEYIRTFSCCYYCNLCEKNPDLNVFLKGWLRRANNTYGGSND